MQSLSGKSEVPITGIIAAPGTAAQGAADAALGRCESQDKDFHDKIDVLGLRDILQDILPDLRIQLERILAAPAA